MNLPLKGSNLTPTLSGAGECCGLRLNFGVAVIILPGSLSLLGPTTKKSVLTPASTAAKATILCVYSLFGKTQYEPCGGWMVNQESSLALSQVTQSSTTVTIYNIKMSAT